LKQLVGAKVDVEVVEVRDLFEGLVRALLDRLLFFGRDVPVPAEPLSRGDGQGIVSEALFCSQDVALVGARLDFADIALPVLLVGVVPLVDRVELEAHRRVADLGASQDPETAIDVFSQDGGLDFFDAHEVLFVQCTQSFHALFQLVESLLELGRVHGYGSSTVVANARLIAE
jgi:hypothetical protein